MSNQPSNRKLGRWPWILPVILAFAVLVIGCGKGGDAGTDKDKDKDKDLTPEQRLFHTHCARCHGNEGKADNSYAVGLKLRPFTARPWKGEVSKEYIRKITVDGIPGTAMPALKTLSKSDLDLLVDYVYKLSTEDGKAKE